jgi:hydroxymethylbilane synthase
MAQTQWVIERLHQQWPNVAITIEQIRTTGDRVVDVPLSHIGGDGVFVTEIERALHEGRIDLAVHSLKDLPTAQPAGLRLVIAGPREDVRDVFVTRSQHESNHPIMRIGTSSLRRTAQLRLLYPHAEILSIRGNVDTRLRKLDAGEYDGIVLAAAGLHRLFLQERLEGRITYFPIEQMMPAPGQGALALEIRDEPTMHELLAPLNDPIAQATTTAERMFMRRLGAGCYLPVASYGEIANDTLLLHGLVISLDGQQQVRVSQNVAWLPTSTLEDAAHLGISLAEQALTQGADTIIGQVDAIRTQERQHV